MAFLTLEDLTGSVEVIAFPNVYEEAGDDLEEESKVFLTGRVSAEEDRDAKLICEKVIPFSAVPRTLWIRFPDTAAWKEGKDLLFREIEEHGGRDKVIIYIENPRLRKELPPGQGVRADRALVAGLAELFGEKNVALN